MSGSDIRQSLCAADYTTCPTAGILKFPERRSELTKLRDEIKEIDWIVSAPLGVALVPTCRSLTGGQAARP
jgi:hypothetical protein